MLKKSVIFAIITYMKKNGKTSKSRRILDLAIYCTGVLLLFYSAVLFLLEFQYVPKEAYETPPPEAPRVTATPTQTPIIPYPTSVNSPLPTPTPLAAPTPTQEPERTSSAVKTPEPTPEFIFGEGDLYPVKLYFIDHKISCRIKPVGLTSDNKMATIRSAYDAGWLAVEPYVIPGDAGKSIIAGHNRWGGKTGSFAVLKKMSVGESVAVEMSDGYARYFTVEKIFEVAYNDNTIMYADEHEPVLMLITCKGDWSSALRTSKTRVVVICSLNQ